MQAVPLQADIPRTLGALLLVAALAVIYWRGTTNARRAGLENSLSRLRVAAFACGLLALFVALSGPVEAAGASWLIAVVGQQQVLTLIAAPLLLLGAPRWAFTLALPARQRRWALGSAGSANLVSRALTTVFSPLPILIIYFLATTVWYAPSIFAALLRSDALRTLVQAIMLAAALLFWSQIIPSRPSRSRLGYVMRALYLGAAGVWSSLMGAFFMYAVGAFYAHYTALARPTGTASAVVDQHLAGAVLDVPGVSIFCVGMLALLYLWLREDERQGAALPVESTGGAARVS